MTTKEHLSLHDRQIATIRALIKEGVHLVIETRKDMRTILAMQKRNEEAIKQMIDSRRATNGHTKGKA
jgi:hypothetical protein